MNFLDNAKTKSLAQLAYVEIIILFVHMTSFMAYNYYLLAKWRNF